MNEQNFTDLALVSLYHFCDICYKARAKRAAGRLFKAGILSTSNLDDVAEAYSKYEEMVVEYALDRLPKGYELRHDYWGAKIISQEKGWRDPKYGLFAGDTCGKIMWFDSFQAMEEYTDHLFETIPALTECEE